ncbi:ABC transporter ATP-binding protein [Marinomonas balearica]|uniref:Maltose ABC transporter ATP-binding protein /trehalose ABC transporter ATP-binding protein /sucrose ABC transporter ATP-binding protein n=1 Tax=Marinomonas balearica TaxID=491947 RepID=A0A4R6M815_9GAMM|nr:sn-glycerol-3-phosphate ABC transporter ATP-binding protein UgpC [Marinomonas balearica]TDO97571.1 maltose ABC transporter ATP-binding protein /trehalose ABC transporter ATP-binding protein /sucrose ABC transporter ATP-binding protein [Marinomonas balearica]
MANVKLTNVKKVYSNNVEVMRDINLDIKQGEFIVFVGPSGCGKSTLLRMISGLEDISSGTLEIDNQDVTQVPPSLRGVAMVFQSYALYPHMTVYDNMAFSLQIAKIDKKEVDAQVRRAAEMLQLTPYLDRLPKALSGGQRQRVAIGRAIVRRPKVFLFDEPLSNLDAALRVATRMEIANLKESMPDSTMIYVTHDQVEAMTLADRIVLLSAGNIEQVGSPLDLYANPENVFVAKFIGSPAMNVMPCIVETAGENTQIKVANTFSINTPIASPAGDSGKPGFFGVRPEDLALAQDGEPALLEGEVSFVESLGEATLLYITVPGLEEAVISKQQGTLQIQKGDTIRVTAVPEKLHLFNQDEQSYRCL